MVAGDIHFKASESKDFFRERRAQAAEYGADARYKLAWRERLYHIIICAGIKAAYAVAFFAARRKHYNGNGFRFFLAAQFRADVNARHSGQHPVKYDNVGVVRLYEPHSL